MTRPFLLVAASFLFTSPLQAQATAMVSAGNPGGILRLLEQTGHEPELEKDDIGDPLITFTLGGYDTSMYFYGCDEDTHDGCTSVQLQTGFDRREPWSAEEAVAVAKSWRYVSVWLDEEGDPFLGFDIVTGKGIPADVFLLALDGYANSVTSTAEMIFPEDGSQNTTDE